MHADTSAVSLAFRRWLKENGIVLGTEIELSRIDVEGGGGNADGSSDGDGGGESDRRPRPPHRPRRRRTVLSTASSAPGALIARVPDSAVLTVSSSSASEALEAAGLGNNGGSGGRGRRRKSPWKEAAGLALALLVEARLGEESRFAPYVRWLLSEGDENDKKTPHPATWDPRAAAVLFAGTAVAPRLLRLPSSSSSGDGPAVGGLHAPSSAPLAWSRLARPWLLSRYGTIEERKKRGKKGGGAGRSLRAEFLRCLAVVSSYAFVLGDDRILALVPVFDALDHAPGPARVRLSHSAGGGGAEGDDSDGDGGESDESDNESDSDDNGDEEKRGENGGFLEMRSTVPLSRGEEVFNSYGRLSTSALARRYGFAGDGGGREAMLRSGDEKFEVRAGEVGVAAAAVAAGSSATLSRRRRPPLRAPAACLRAAAASRGRPLFVSVPSGEPSLGLLLAARASLLPVAKLEEDEERRASLLLLLEGRTLLEVARRRRAALEAGGARAARALSKLVGKKRKRGGGGKKDGSSGIVFPPASGFELAEAVRRSELEGCDCLESWVRRMLL